jgi:glycosyltransferase involved in cell wall biosynthesis
VLVSAILPTSGRRRRFIPQAVACFRAQTWPATELVVVDDTRGGVEDLLPDVANIRYAVMPYRGSASLQLLPRTGAKRNYACGLARGELIAHWDDDDWSAPDRLTIQVAALRTAPKAVLTGFRPLLFFDERDQSAWRYEGRTDYVAGTTFCYRKAFWRTQPFADVLIQEDNYFLDYARRAGLAVVEQGDVVVARIHAGNTAPKLGSPSWRKIPLSALPEEFPKQCD